MAPRIDEVGAMPQGPARACNIGQETPQALTPCGRRGSQAGIARTWSSGRRRESLAPEEDGIGRHCGAGAGLRRRSTARGGRPRGAGRRPDRRPPPFCRFGGVLPDRKLCVRSNLGLFLGDVARRDRTDTKQGWVATKGHKGARKSFVSVRISAYFSEMSPARRDRTDTKQGWVDISEK